MAQRRTTIGIFGAGYAGLVTGACFAELGHSVVLRDILPERIEALEAGSLPIYEPGLAELLERNRERIRFTLDAAEAAEDADFIYICVGTPSTYSGDADLSAVWAVLDELTGLARPATVVMKSTVPVGTGAKVRAALDARGLGHVGYVSNPEFLAEGTAVRDFMQPDRIVIGALSEADGDAVEALHAGLDAPVVRTDVASAEMIKLASNAFLSVRISFINEIANVCELVGADVEQVAKGVGLDHRLGPHFLRAGIGFGGSCLVGDETVLVRSDRRTRLVTFQELFEQAEEGQALEVLSWRRDGQGSEFLSVALLTRREYEDEIVEVRTKMGRRVRCTPDHPFVTQDGVKLASELTTEDWLPVAQLAPPSRVRRPLRLDVLAGLAAAEATPRDVIVRPGREQLAAVGVRAVQSAIATLEHPRGAVARSHDILRSGALRLDELSEPGLALDGGSVGTVKNGTYVPTSIEADEAFWRVVGLYLAEGHCYKQRIPDLIWDEPQAHKRALLAGLWLGDGSWSYVNGGPSVVLEYGTVSRELADGMLRLLGDVGIVARLKVGRTARSTRDTYWFVVSGADQIERLLDLVPERHRRPILESIARQSKRIAPTGYRKRDNAAWVRVVEVMRRRYAGYVYSLEVPPAHTFVTTGGLVLSNCFPKDVSALKQLAGNSGYHFQLLSAVIEVNELQKRRVVGKLEKHLGPLRGKTVALLGLAFKPNTDDLREAPSIVLASRLLAEGAEVRAWDPVADASEALQGVTFCDSVLEAVQGADAAVIVTEWPELKALVSPETREAMRRPLIVDGRNLLDPQAARAAGFVYEGIGRPTSAAETLPETEPELHL